ANGPRRPGRGTACRTGARVETTWDAADSWALTIPPLAVRGLSRVLALPDGTPARTPASAGSAPVRVRARHVRRRRPRPRLRRAPARATCASRWRPPTGHGRARRAPRRGRPAPRARAPPGAGWTPPTA